VVGLNPLKPRNIKTTHVVTRVVPKRSVKKKATVFRRENLSCFVKRENGFPENLKATVFLFE